MSAPTARAAGTWPNLFVVGEPRSGTSSLHEILSRHPEIYMSTVKEPHYYSTIEFPSIESAILKTVRDPDTYARLFGGATEAIRGESSTYYLADPGAARRIKADVPDAKIIAMLRDPVERAYSHYLLYNRRGTQELTFRETVTRNIDGGDEQALVYDVVELGRYHKHLSRYFEYFDEDQVLVVLFDDLMRQREVALAQVYDFLGVETSDAGQGETVEAQNAYARPRGGLAGAIVSNRLVMRVGLATVPRPLLRFVRNRLLLKAGEKPTMEPEARALLQEVYAPEIVKLEQLLGRSLDGLRRTWT